MSGQPAEGTGALTERRTARRAARSRPGPTPLGFAAWLASRADELAGAWSDEIRLRGVGQGAEVDRVVDVFLEQLTHLVPMLLGPHGEHVQPLWERASELFGTMAAKRGLAAGEVIEEFQILRALIIRRLYEDPPDGGLPRLRDLLRINRFLDRGVTHASVGHTDAMFFRLLEEGESQHALSPAEAALEAEAQLDLILEELAEVQGVSGEVTPGAVGH